MQRAVAAEHAIERRHIRLSQVAPALGDDGACARRDGARLRAQREVRHAVARQRFDVGRDPVGDEALDDLGERVRDLRPVIAGTGADLAGGPLDTPMTTIRSAPR